MHHEFDGIVEINNQLPAWWTKMFYVVMVWGLVYFLLYPGLGNFQGLLGWKSSNQDVRSLAESKAAVVQAREDAKNSLFGVGVQYDREIEFAKETFDPIFDAYAQKSVLELQSDVEALKVGQRLFLQNCSQCHGSDARGQRGFPNLTDNDWLYGGTPEKIKETLMNGRIAQMPAWIDALGEAGVKDTVAYVLSLSGREVDQAAADRGKANFAMCAACHGADGKGNYAFGAPNLTDNIWLYGGHESNLIETLTYGRNGVMPSFKNTLGEDKIHVVAAYVYSLSNK